MRTGCLICLFSIFATLAGCCAPDTCSSARSRFAELDPVIVGLVAFEGENGRFPERLEEAFPAGLPDGLTAVEGQDNLYRFAKERGGLSTFWYGRGAGIGASPDAVGLRFSYVGGGLIAGMNDCFWTEADRQWRCSGYL